MVRRYMPKRTWTPVEQKAIDNNPGLPVEVAAAFAEDLNEIGAVTGVSFSRSLGVPDGEGCPPAAQGSIQELCPHLRDSRFV